MSQNDNTIEETPEYDLDVLKAKADLLGLTYHPNIGGEKLKAKIDLHLTEAETEIVPETETPVNVKSVGPNKTVRDIEKAARKPVRCVITDNDPAEQSNPTIVHTVQNKFFKIGVIIKKDAEQDVPAAVVKALRAKTMIKWVNSINSVTKRPTGNKVPTTKKRFNIQLIRS